MDGRIGKGFGINPYWDQLAAIGTRKLIELGRHDGTQDFFRCVFLFRIFCHSVSRRRISSFETVNSWRTALSNRWVSVSPGTLGAG